MRNLFSEHPASVGETYCEHLRQATSFGFRMVVGGTACLLHGIFPFLFVKTGSAAVDTLHDRMVVNRARRMGQKHAPTDRKGVEI
jgi:hypothetical protein